ncbi:MAG: gliding motility-associated C-terminal domain-containing protein, partial [Flavobacteriales bacterium]|nr:gliding motility-associated C-terminal domain-containing protein [Flavobacteriales bacterium]
DIAAGTYQLTVTDENDCTVLSTFHLSEPQPITVAHQTSAYNGYAISCPGAMDGFIDATIAGGTAAYDIAWTGPDGFTANTAEIHDLGAGTYTLQVTDANGCTHTAEVTLEAPLPIDVAAVTSTSPSGDAVACHGASTGTITLAIMGGALPVGVTWAGPDGYTGNGAHITGLAAGTYIATVADANGCEATVTVTLTEPAPIDVTPTISAYNEWEVSCAGATDGSIATAATGGHGTLTYAWTGPGGFSSSAAAIAGLGAGTYTLTVTDENGCSVTHTYVLEAPDPIGTLMVLGEHGDHHVSCSDAADGSIVLTVTGGTAPYTIDWNGPDGPVAGGLELHDLAAGTYTVTVTDANGCVHEASITLSAPAPMSTTVRTSTYGGDAQVSCAGAQDGSIDLTVTGATAPYTYVWSDGLGFTSTEQDISGLAPGTYTVTVTDAMGCTTTLSVTLTAPDPLTLAAELSGTEGSHVSCADALDGSIALTITGGVAPYTYLWNTNSQAGTLTGIGAGTYSVTVTDANGCTITGTWTLEAPEPITAEATVAVQPGGHGTTCHGGDDGAITTVVSGGTAPYTYAWSGPNGFTAGTADITNLFSGTYTLFITDAQGCTHTLVAQVTQPQPVTVQLNSSTVGGGHHIACAGETTGSVDLNVTGGTAGYTYAWTGPDGFSSTDAAISGLAAGTYDVTVTDANGCTGTASITLTEPDPLMADAVLSDAGAGFEVGCTNDDGAIAVTILGGTAPISFGWTGPDGFASTDAAIDGLAAGTYTLTATDANGCTLVQSWTLTAPGPITAEFDHVANTCPDDATGAIDMDVQGGAAPYTISWEGPDGFTSADAHITGLVAGDYTVTITDQLGCIAIIGTTLEGPAPLESGAYVSFFGLHNIQCHGDSTGVIELAPMGGTAPYSIMVTGPGGYASDSTAHSGLWAGDYLIAITDAHNCVMDTLITLTEPDMPIEVEVEVSVYPSGTNVSCHGASDGWINATATGGAGEFTFVWRGPDGMEWDTPFVDGLPAGDYSYELVVTDQNECTYFMEVTLTQPDSALQATIEVSQYEGGHNVPCSDAVNGTITVAATGGNGGYAFAWTGPGGFTSEADTLTGLAPGDYVLTLTDMNGCEVVETVTIGAPEPLTIALNTIAHISCHGADDGAVEAAITGGTPGHTLVWTGPFGITSSEPMISGLPPGTYCLTVTDANGCIAESCIDITEPEPLSVAVTTAPAACGEAIGTVTPAVSGGTAPYAHLWSTGPTTPELTGLEPGTYTVLVTDANGCSAMATGEVTGTPAVTADATVTGNTCHGDAEGTIALEVPSGAAPFTYAWSNGGDTPLLEGLAAGTYDVTVTDANGCTFTGSWAVWEADAIVIDTLLSVYSGGYNVSTHGGSDGSIQTGVSGGTPPYTYDWSTGAGTPDLHGLSAGEYVLTVTDANGCTAEMAITVTEPDDLAMPTGFTPNGDGANDTFFVRGLDAYPTNTFVVFNRWGNVVYDRLNYANDWAGENQQQEALPNGTYFVILKVNAGERTLQGYVDLRR